MKWPLSDRLRQYLEIQYVLERVLGEGGMGAVLLATEKALDRRVAIKVLRADVASQADLRERFRREARTAARLNHPNIVPLYTFGEVDEELYFVMGYVEGETLGERLRRDGTLEAGDVRHVIAQLADALDYAHRAGVVHRDIKPENVLIEHTSGRPMLTDFGIAREASQSSGLTKTGMIVGTPHYMSPEQASADPTVDGRSDIYSLGVIAYRAFAGRLPFDGASMQEVLVQHMTVDPAPIPAERTLADAALADVIARALRKAPADRWQSARELAQALRLDDADEVLPDSLMGIEGLFVPSTAFLAGGAIAAAVVPALGFDVFAGHLQALAVGALSVAALAVAPLQCAYSHVKDKHPFSTAWRIGWRAPKSWKGWWPRGLRRPGDVSDQLPADVHFARSLNTIMGWAIIPPMVAFLLWMLFGSGQARLVEWSMTKGLGVVGVWAGLAVVIGMAPMLAMIWLTKRFARHFDLSGQQAEMLLQLTNTDPRWRQERFAQLLGSRSGLVRSATKVTGRRDAIEALVRELELARTPFPVDILDAVRAADAAGADIAREITRLRNEVDPDEIAKLDRRLAALGGGERDADLRNLLSGQRDLLARLEARIGELSARKLRVDEQLRLLHQQLLALRAGDADLHSEITGQIRAVNDELCRLAEAQSDVEELVKPV